ncbi:MULTISPECIES: 3-phosphoshikimate 1-carboxyvinyltransferase [Alteromonadaceae]|jgi:3-phosphoshikimate 1-carboxyvinyltransferase|uniref:3-phosphoshikimate 1-carboxyvinyltransferase n=1 Tax=Brumicola blandensis TaxID=3075611 RepID=A0AAW8QWD4_9ALTE|nr:MULTISPECIES: 3-phosphoshikimate 1-carboxyvinyltransferase [unclassified Alteromonas]MDT0581411.1 3-phosphoshikimate 1-carboxyvinyltransferase [Alteromonas sp. W409]MDT0627039.1 3-phosphoshikimate 1-carboxyvinyltransferase [Alteromonas sp. W364]
MESLTLEPINAVAGEVNVPGSKSLSNRALLLAAVSTGTTTLTNLLDSDDIRHMLNALSALGVQFDLSPDKTKCTVQGMGGRFSCEKELSLFLGNAGTAMRPLCAALAFSDVNVELTGEPRMEERPIGDLVDPLIASGAHITYLKETGFPPLKIQGQAIDASRLEVDGTVSSQFLTALLMAAPLLTNDLEIVIKGELVSKPYIDITLKTMQAFGVSVDNNEYKSFHISADAQYQSPGEFLVEGDASSASYFLAAAAIKGGTVKVTGVGKASIQGDVAFADVLEKMGAIVEWGDDFIQVTGAPLNAVDMDMNHIPDAAMTIATTALFAKGTTRISNVYNWRVKETDRLHAMATELKKVGASVVEGHDFIEVTPPTTGLQHASIDTYNDHRMAMCFSLLALGDAGITINDPKCTAKTFPTYFQTFSTISR